MTSWRDFTGYCQELNCRKSIPHHAGIFCANFSVKRGIFPPCRGCWCGPCYKPLGTTPFYIHPLLDEDGIEIPEDDLGSRYMVGRDGDHYLVPFQCELCHFRNIQQRDPMAGHGKDEFLMDFIVRANLDAFWSREASTVQANLRGAVRSWKTKDNFSLRENSLFPVMGPHPLKD